MKNTPGASAKRKRIEFTLHAPNAESVFLSGSFNDWSRKQHPMKKNAAGDWKKVLMLPQGDYEYKFWVDDQWWTDPGNERCCENCFGTLNSIVCVRP